MTPNIKRRKLDDKSGFAIVIVPMLLVAIFAVAILLSNPLEYSTKQVSIKEFEATPKKFAMNDKGNLILELENLNSSQPISVVLFFETHENVAIHKGDVILPKNSGNYTFTKQLEPSEHTTLTFSLIGTLETGDNSRDYYVSVYCYVNDKFGATATASFTVTKG